MELKANYKEIENDRLPNLKEFLHDGSMHGEWYEGNYLVFSYTTIMLELNENKKIIYYNDGKYSKTTSNQQNLIIRVFKDKLIEGGWIDD